MSQKVTTFPSRRSRRLVLTGAVSVALISTGSAYLAMVQFGIDVLEMDPVTAYTTAGVFELSLVTVALLAREAARDNRPGGTLLALTWALSSASGIFAAWHEAYIGHPIGAVVFRFIVPLLAALMWHLALIGDRHLATGTSWSALRQSARMHALFLRTEDLFRAQNLADGSRAARRRLARAEKARRGARAVALRTVPPTEMRAQVVAWCEALKAVGDGTADVAQLHVEDRRRLAGVIDDLENALRPERDAMLATVRELRGETGVSMETDVDSSLETVSAGLRGGLSAETPVSGSAPPAGETTDAIGETPRAVSAAVESRSLETARVSVRDRDRGKGQPSPAGPRRPARRPGRRMSDEEVAEIVERGAHQAPQVIAEAMGVGLSTVYKKLALAGVVPTPAHGVPRVDNPSPLPAASPRAADTGSAAPETARWTDAHTPGAGEQLETPRFSGDAAGDELANAVHGDIETAGARTHGSLASTSRY